MFFIRFVLCYCFLFLNNAPLFFLLKTITKKALKLQNQITDFLTLTLFFQFEILNKFQAILYAVASSMSFFDFL